MSDWLWLVSGMLAWQALVLLIYFITDDEEKAVYVAVGAPGLVYLCLAKTVKSIALAVNSHRYVSLLRNQTDGRLYYCRSSNYLADTIMWYDDAYDWARDLRAKYKPSDGWREYDCTNTLVNFRYTPIKVAKAEGATPIDEAVVKAAVSAWKADIESDENKKG